MMGNTNRSNQIRRLIFAGILLATVASAPAFERSDWSVRCWNGDSKRWEDVGVARMTFEKEGGATKVTNTTGIHRHAHLVFPARLTGDFSFTIEVKGGYELGFLNREGKDEMLYLELEGSGTDEREFETYVLSREGTRLSVSKNGRTMPLVHFRFDYGEDLVITLAIESDENAVVRSYALEQQ